MMTFHSPIVLDSRCAFAPLPEKGVPAKARSRKENRKDF
jgi:hypothetical protein